MASCSMEGVPGPQNSLALFTIVLLPLATCRPCPLGLRLPFLNTRYCLATTGSTDSRLRSGRFWRRLFGGRCFSTSLGFLAATRSYWLPSGTGLEGFDATFALDWFVTIQLVTGTFHQFSDVAGKIPPTGEVSIAHHLS
jgi:hypothetical protein